MNIVRNKLRKNPVTHNSIHKSVNKNKCLNINIIEICLKILYNLMIIFEIETVRLHKPSL